MDEINIISTAEAIRQRPHMYLPVTLDDPSIIPVLISEALCFSLDEAAQGDAKNIHIRIHVDGSFSIADDGKGMSLELKPSTNRPIAESIMTQLMACRNAKLRKEIGEKYCHFGMVVTNALSRWCILEIQQEGQLWRQNYKEGEPIIPLQIISQSQSTGTLIRFKPDPHLIKKQEFNIEELRQRLCQAAQDVPGTRVQLTDERTYESTSLLDICFPRAG